MLDKIRLSAIITYVVDAALAHPVERHLAKVEVASSSLVSRSKKTERKCVRFFAFLRTFVHYAVILAGFSINFTKNIPRSVKKISF